MTLCTIQSTTMGNSSSSSSTMKAIKSTSLGRKPTLSSSITITKMPTISTMARTDSPTAMKVLMIRLEPSKFHQALMAKKGLKNRTKARSLASEQASKVPYKVRNESLMFVNLRIVVNHFL